MMIYVVIIRDNSDGATWVDSAFNERYFAEVEVGLLRPIYGVHYSFDIREIEVQTSCPVRLSQEEL